MLTSDACSHQHHFSFYSLELPRQNFALSSRIVCKIDARAKRAVSSSPYDRKSIVFLATFIQSLSRLERRFHLIIPAYPSLSRDNISPRGKSGQRLDSVETDASHPLAVRSRWFIQTSNVRGQSLELLLIALLRCMRCFTFDDCFDIANRTNIWEGGILALRK